MTLLCPQHHNEKTVGRMPVDVVIQANTSPFNRSEKLGGSTELYFSGDLFEVDFGEVRSSLDMSNEDQGMSALRVDGMTVVGARRSGNRVLINANIRDADNQPLLEMRDGELRHATGKWDVTYVGKTLRILAGTRDLLLEVTFEAPDRVKFSYAHLWANGVLISITRDGTLAFPFDNLTFWGFTLEGGVVGFEAGWPYSSSPMTMIGVPGRRQLGGLPADGIESHRRWRGEAAPAGMSLGGPVNPNYWDSASTFRGGLSAR
jgi:hypothetical protein